MWTIDGIVLFGNDIGSLEFVIVVIVIVDRTVYFVIAWVSVLGITRQVVMGVS